MTPEDLRQILDTHDQHWEDQRGELLRYKAVYEANFWDEESADKTQIRIQTNDGYGYIEGYQASLFAKNPSVVLKPGVKARGDSKKAEQVVNHFLNKSRKQIEAASRMALIYPNSFIKMVPSESDDVYDKVIPCAVPPWEIIVDRDAIRWDLQRFVGHIYWMNVPKANDRFNKGKKFSEMGGDIEDYFDADDASKDEYKQTATETSKSDMFKYVKIVEIYDLIEDKLYWWTPAIQDKWLDQSDFIPFRTHDDRPCPPIVPFYYNNIPDRPLDGYSSLKRIYDQLYEMNIIRSFQANAVRKASRQWLVKKGELSSEEMAKVTSGVDGLFIEVDTEEALSSIIQPIPQQQTPIEVSKYYQDVAMDKDKGSVIAPFTRGEVTKATATEIAALAAYTSSEIGRMARERDACIEYMGKVYLAILSLYMSEEGKAVLVVLNGKATVLGRSDVDGDFQIYAADQAATPVSEAVHKQQFLASVPMLVQLGVSHEEILKELVRLLKLPESFSIERQEQPEGALPGQSSQKKSPPSANEAIRNPSMPNVSAFLPNMGET